MAIRYDKKLNQEINKIVRNYNQKIYRIRRYEDSYNYQIPSIINKTQLKSMAYTRKELRRKLNELKRYSQRGAEFSIQLPSGNIISKYEFENLRKERARVKRKLTNEIKRLETEKPTVYGKEQATTFAQMGDSYYLSNVGRRNAIDINWKDLTKEEFEKFKERVYKIGRNIEYESSLFRDNYKKMLFDLAYYTGYDEEKIKLLESKIDSLNNKKFYKLFNTEKGIKAITEYYLLITGKKMKRVDPSAIREDVWQNYDNLIENIDDIIGKI